MNASQDKITRKPPVEYSQWWHHPALFAAVQQKGNFGYCEWDYVNRYTKSCTPEFAAIYGMTVEELLESQSNWDKILAQLHPDDRSEYEALYAQQGKMHSFEIEYRVYRKDGALRYVRETGVGLYDIDTGENIAIGMVLDITDAKVHAQELTESIALNHQSELLIDIGQFIWSIERDRYKSISPGFARIHGMSVNEFLADIEERGEDLTDIFPEDRAFVRASFDKQLSTKCGLQIEYRLLRSDGAVRWIREQSTVVWDPVYSSHHVAGVLQDITEQKNNEQQLLSIKDSLEAKVSERTRELSKTVLELQRHIEERQKISSELERHNAELERFVYTVSHELKTPLVTIKGFVGMLEKDLNENDRVRVDQDLSKIADAADTMGKQLYDLLELSTKGHSAEKPVICNLEQAADSAINRLDDMVRKANVSVTVDQMPNVLAHPDRLIEVYSNLIENSIKFKRDQISPHISIGARVSNDSVHCYVRDNGVGILPQYHERVFRIFERLNTSIEGTGVGLAIVKRIIENYGGDIKIKSRGADKGCEVIFELPSAKE